MTNQEVASDVANEFAIIVMEHLKKWDEVNEGLVYDLSIRLVNHILARGGEIR